MLGSKLSECCDVARTWRNGVTAVALLAIFVIVPAALSQTVTFNKATLAGDPVSGSTVTGLVDSCIGPAGHIVVRGTIDGGTRNSVITGPSAGPFVIAAKSNDGTPPPGTSSGVVFTTFLDAWPDSSGRVVIVGNLGGTGVTTTNGRGIWVFNGSNLVKVARDGDAAPGLPSGTVFTGTSSGFVTAFSNGRIAFITGLSGGGTSAINDQALWLFNTTTGTTTLIARKGASGVVPGITWAGFSEVQINAAGTVAFIATLNSSTTTDTVIATSNGTPDSFILIAREGSTAPGMGPGVLFRNDFSSGFGRGSLSLNDAGELVFTGDTTAGTLTTGAWRRSGGITALVSRIGDAAPGFAAPVPAMGTPQHEIIGGPGFMAWDCTMSGTGVTVQSDRTLFRRSDTGVVSSIIREGQAAPGEVSGVTFGPGNVSYLFDYAINATGKMLIESSLAGLPEFITGTAPGVFGSDPAINGGAAFKLFHRGETVQLSGIPGHSSGTLTSFTIRQHSGTQLGYPVSLNDSGMFVIEASISAFGGPYNGAFLVQLAPGVASGACCSGSTCSVGPQTSCTGPNTRFAGASTVCNGFGGNNTTPCCLADFNQSGAVSVQDVFDFLAAFFSGSSRADINGGGAGAPSVQDVFDFLGVFFAGCA
jgi:hypothetical protein